MRSKTEIKGQTISYIKVGNGPRNILCFPGFLGTNWSDFKPQIEGLNRDEFTIVAWDPPGYGFSRPPNRVFNSNFFENDADLANNLMQNIGLNKFSLLGWSDGGISSLILAAKYQQNVEKLIIWGANSYVTAQDLEAIARPKDAKSAIKQSLPELRRIMFTCEYCSRSFSWKDNLKRHGDCRFKALVCCQCNGVSKSEGALQRHVREKHQAPKRKAEAPLQPMAKKARLDLQATRDISKWSDRIYVELVELYTEESLRKMWDDWFNTFEEMFKNGGDICRDYLKNIQCPTFILHGDQDPFIPFEHVQYLLDNVKQTMLHRYAEGRHDIHLHYANDFNERVSDFILSNHQ